MPNPKSALIISLLAIFSCFLPWTKDAFWGGVQYGYEGVNIIFLINHLALAAFFRNRILVDKKIKHFTLVKTWKWTCLILLIIQWFLLIPVMRETYFYGVVAAIISTIEYMAFTNYLEKLSISESNQ